MRAFLVCVVLALLIGVPTLADDSALGAVGGTLQPMIQHPSVRMVSEDVNIKVGPDNIKVACKFVFRNEGKAVDVKMGFPEDHGGDSSGFRYFKARVDGKPVAVRHIKSPREEGADSRDWWVKTVHFNAGQTRVVEDFYGGRPSGDSMGGTWLTYVLQTGRSWKGPIGRAVVRVDLSAVRDYQTIIPQPSGYRRQGDTLVWDWKNIEPREDIGVRYRWNYSWFVVDGEDMSEMTPYRRSWPDEDRSPVPRVVNGILMVPNDVLEQVLRHTRCEPHAKIPKSMVVTCEGKSLVLTADSRKAVIGGNIITLPRAPKIMGGRMAIPLLSVGQALGFKITRDSVKGITYINSPRQPKSKATTSTRLEVPRWHHTP